MPWLTKLDSGNWRAVYRGPDGCRRSLTRPTKTMARQEALEMEAQIRRGAWHDPTLSRITFAEWVEKWRAGRSVETATTDKNASHLKNHLLPRWRLVRLDGISHEDVQSWVAGLKHARKDEKAGAETARQCHALLSSILEAAVRAGRLRTNPTKGIELPAVGKKAERWLSAPEVDKIRGEMTGQDAVMVRMGYETGMRWGEIAGLHVQRLDLPRKTVRVVEVATRRGAVKAHPKSKMSHRTLPLTDRLVTELEPLVKGKQGADLVFTADPKAARTHEHSTLMIDYSNWRRRVWDPARKTVPAPSPTFHDLRHSFCSRLAAGGVDIVTIQRMAGHESLRTTQRYMHLAPGADDRVRAVLEALDSPGTHKDDGEASQRTPDQEK